jgi:glycerate 2-kinase
MNILIAPDKFKGSLDAQQVCQAVRVALEQCDDSLTCIGLPLADGGEGTCALLTAFKRGDMIHVAVRDPLFRTIESEYGISNDGSTAFIEMAKASGLQLLNAQERDPLLTSSVGTGDLIRAALDRGVSKIILGIGGSATNDAGMGIGEALGLKFFSAGGGELRPIGWNLKSINGIDVDHLHPRCKGAHITILCDVDNPLFGERGAAFVFAPQKGADTASVKILDEGLQHAARVFARTFNVDVNFPGAGAAGGVSIMIKALMHADVKPGMDFITAFTGLEKAVQAADVIITGEGKIDAQTLSGKVLKGVANLAVKYAKPVIAITGKCELPPDQLKTMGIAKVITLANDEISDHMAMRNAFEILKKRTIEEVFPLLISFKN